MGSWCWANDSGVCKMLAVLSLRLKCDAGAPNHVVHLCHKKSNGVTCMSNIRLRPWTGSIALLQDRLLARQLSVFYLDMHGHARHDTCRRMRGTLHYSTQQARVHGQPHVPAGHVEHLCDRGRRVTVSVAPRVSPAPREADALLLRAIAGLPHRCAFAGCCTHMSTLQGHTRCMARSKGQTGA